MDSDRMVASAEPTTTLSSGLWKSTSNSTGTLRTQVYQKTTYDPSVWPDERIITTTSEAFQNAISGGLTSSLRDWTGFDSNGIQVSGFYNGDVANPQITTFWIGTP